MYRTCTEKIYGNYYNQFNGYPEIHKRTYDQFNRLAGQICRILLPVGRLTTCTYPVKATRYNVSCAVLMHSVALVG